MMAETRFDVAARGPRRGGYAIRLVRPTQPRLVVDGDVKGGRYVSATTKLVVGEG